MGKVIKVIDLLNMIAKGEELPKKIKIYGEEFSLEENSKCYSYYDWNMGIKHFLFAFFNNESLNDEVEILDEEDEIDIQKINEEDLIIMYETRTKENYSHSISVINKKIMNTINNLIDEVEKLKKLESNK